MYDAWANLLFELINQSICHLISYSIEKSVKKLKGKVAKFIIRVFEEELLENLLEKINWDITRRDRWNDDC